MKDIIINPPPRKDRLYPVKIWFDKIKGALCANLLCQLNNGLYAIAYWRDASEPNKGFIYFDDEISKKEEDLVPGWRKYLKIPSDWEKPKLNISFNRFKDLI